MATARKPTKKTETGRAPLGVVNFRADDAVIAAIDKLAAAVDVPGLAPNGIRSFAIRRALLAAAAALDEQGGAK